MQALQPAEEWETLHSDPPDLQGWQVCPVQEVKLLQGFVSVYGGTDAPSSLHIILLAVGGYLLQSLDKLTGLLQTSNVKCVGF